MKLKIFLAFTAIYLIWGSTYLAAYFGLGSIPPYLMSALRFTAAGMILLGLSFFKGYPLPPRKNILVNALGGIMMLVGGSGSVLWAQQYIPSGLAAILVSALPIWFVILDRKQWPLYFSNRLIILGVLLGFAGIILLFGSNAMDATQTKEGYMKSLGILVIIAGTIMWTIGSLYTKYNSPNQDVTVSASIQLLAAGLFSFCLSPFLDSLTSFSFAEVSLQAWLALFYLIIFGSVIGYLSYVFLLSVRPAAQVGTHAYVNPVIAVVLGIVFINENISLIQMIALVVILASVVLINRKTA